MKVVNIVNEIKSSWDILKITNNYESHTIEKGHPEIKIAIIDSGVDYDHPGLKNNINNIINLVEDESYEDFTGHGTMVSGQIIGSDILKGVVPNCHIDIIKVLDCNNKSTFERLIKALEYVYTNNYNIVNMSLGLSIKNKNMDEIKYPLELLKKMNQANIMCVNPVSYDTPVEWHFPSVSKHTFTVQSLSKNYGIVNSKMASEFALPSGDFLCTSKEYYNELIPVHYPLSKSKQLKQMFGSEYKLPLGYAYYMGESLASAKLSGIIAAILSRNLRINNTNLSVNEVKKLLKTHSKNFDGRYCPQLTQILKSIN